MLKNPRHHIAILVIAVVLSLVIVACGKGKSTDGPQRQADASIPGRSVEKPLKAERISQEEYDAADAAAKGSLVETPKFPFPPDARFTYSFFRGVNPAGSSKIAVKSRDDGGFVVTGQVDLFWADDEKKTFKSTISCSFDGKLRPIECNFEMPDILSGQPVPKRVDFKAEKFGAEYLVGPGGGKGFFKEIERQPGDIWPFLPHWNFDIAIIAACTGPPKDGDAEVSVLNIDQDQVDRFALNYLGEKNITFKTDGRTERLAEYESFYNDNFYGWLYFNPDGLLVMVDEVGGICAEYVSLPGPERVDNTEVVHE